MLTLAAPGDTWGISGPDFLKAYGGALVVFLLAAILFRIRAIHGGTDSPNSPAPGQIAMLESGPTRAVHVSLASLRAAGVVAVGQLRELQTTDPAPAGLSRLDHAVYDAASRRVQVSRLQADPGVRSALDDLRDSLVRAGWVLEPAQRHRARLGAWLVLALVGLGLIRLVAGIANDRPVGYLLLFILPTAVIGGVLLAVPRRSAAGKRAIAQARTTHGHLAPNQSPAWATYGVTGAAMGVALFGTAALWAADPAFAAEAGMRREGKDAAGGSSGCGAGSGDGGGSGGSSCSGGGSGGGGGCGGGGCGG
jgi:uncharacterized protein (TIGR04222 family)